MAKIELIPLFEIRLNFNEIIVNGTSDLFQFRKWKIWNGLVFSRKSLVFQIKYNIVCAHVQLF